MAKKYDATMRNLARNYIRHFLGPLHLTCDSSIVPLDTNISTISREADCVMKVDSESPWILHIEFQASSDAGLSARLFLYNALLYEHYGIPIHTAVFLLRPEADHASLTGRLQYNRHGPSGLEFTYQTVRVWERPPEEFLDGGLGTLPLAPLSRVSQKELPAIIQKMDELLSRDTIQSEVKELWLASFVLMGLRYDKNFLDQLLSGVQRKMEESVTYQAILEKGKVEGKIEGEHEGRIKEARNILIAQGTVRWGPPSFAERERLYGIDDAAKLEKLSIRILTANSWEELLKDGN